MKKFLAIFLTVQFVLMISHELYSQSDPGLHEFGITAGGFTNFPANKDYLKEDISVFYIAPYIRTGQHEFYAGIVYPLSTHRLSFNESNINPRLGAMGGYKFYIFNVYSRENLFVHYTFQYLRFKGDYDVHNSWTTEVYPWTETDTYINNVIGLGYNLFFDINRRFGLYYTLDYVISQAGYKLGSQGFNNNYWRTQYIWNNLSTNFGFVFKITSLKRNDK